jgi:hypothetical protein
MWENNGEKNNKDPCWRFEPYVRLLCLGGGQWLCFDELHECNQARDAVGWNLQVVKGCVTDFSLLLLLFALTLRGPSGGHCVGL